MSAAERRWSTSCAGAEPMSQLARLADGGQDRVGQLVDGGPATAAHVEDGAERLGHVEDAHPRIDDVTDVDEVPGLQAVAVNRDRLAAERVADEDREHALIRVVDALALSVR